MKAKKPTLSLVDKHDFEDWLVVRFAISRTELQVRDSLIELQLRIDAAFGRRGTTRVFSPYSPAALCDTFFEVIRHLALKNKVVEVVFKVLQTSILAHLETAYQEFNPLLVKADILPDLDVSHYPASQTQQIRPQRPSASLAAPEPQLTVEHPDTVTAVPLRAEELVTGQQSSDVYSAPAVGQAYVAASQLMSLQRLLSPATAEAVHSGQAMTNRIPQPSHAALTALDGMKARVLQGEVSFNGPGTLKTQLIQAPGGARIDLSGFEHDSVEMIETLFESIVQNERVAEDLKEELHKLQVPLLKIMLKDPELFSGDFHPARQAVNFLALLSDQVSINLEANKGPIRDSIRHILESDEDTLAFSQSLDALVQKIYDKLAFDSSHDQLTGLLTRKEFSCCLAQCVAQAQQNQTAHTLIFLDIQLVLPGDERLEELDEVMIWVTRINRALDENNLKLRCQKIAPLNNQESALPHYEVLLTVIDDQGEHMPPAEFIKVAEDYNRMSSVDRWMMEHQDQMHLFG
jgi:hypothetical protein